MRLIDADKLIYSNIKTNGYGYVEVIETVVLEQDIANAKTVQAIPIPVGTTNGDVIKAMFPKIEIYTDVINGIVDVEICEDSSELRCSVDWWNAPYKRGDLDGSN